MLIRYPLAIYIEEKKIRMNLLRKYFDLNEIFHFDGDFIISVINSNRNRKNVLVLNLMRK